jgi:hypothetical protein
MDISTLQSVLDSAATMLATHRVNMMDDWTDEDLNIEVGMERVIRMLKDTLDAELEARDAAAASYWSNDSQWIDYVVRSALENNTFGDHCSWDGAYDEAAEELNVDHNTLCDAFDRVTDDIKNDFPFKVILDLVNNPDIKFLLPNGRVRSVVQEAA